MRLSLDGTTSWSCTSAVMLWWMEKHCELPDQAEVRLLVTVRSPRARYRSVVFRSTPIDPGPATYTIEFHVDGRLIAESLSLDTELVLAQNTDAPGAFVAHLPGSRLFSELL